MTGRHLIVTAIEVEAAKGDRVYFGDLEYEVVNVVETITNGRRTQVYYETRAVEARPNASSGETNG